MNFPTGKKKMAFVIAAGAEIARQGVSEEDEEHVGWVHTDASGMSVP
jgi:hypothetical protein